MTEIACVVEAHDALGECCLWCPATRRVWWLDIQKPCLQSYDPVEPGAPGLSPARQALRLRGAAEVRRLRAGAGQRPARLRSRPPASSACSCTPSRTSPATATTTAAATAAAGCGSAPWTSSIRRASGSFYRIGADRSVLRLFDGITVPNSTAFSPDDRTLYFADTPRHVIWAFDFDLACRHDRRPPGVRRPHGAQGPARRLLRRRRGLSLERRIRRPSPDPLRAGRPPRPHHRAAGDQSDLLLLRRRQPRHALCHQRDARRRSPAATPAAMEGGLLALDVGVRGLPEAAFGG